MSPSASRKERTEIEPVNMCLACPQRGDCTGVASAAVDTYMKASFVTIEPVSGDPDFFAGRRYIDDQGRESELFLAQDDDLVRTCKGPIRPKQRWFRKGKPECAAHAVTLDAFEARLQAREQAKQAARGSSVMLTSQELQDLRALHDEDFASLASLPTDQLDDLVLYNRQRPQ